VSGHDKGGLVLAGDLDSLASALILMPRSRLPGYFICDLLNTGGAVVAASRPGRREA